MSFYDYKVVPAPRRSKKTKGVREPADLFALTLTEAINEHARAGWEYVRSESIATEIPGGFMRRAREHTVVVLVFRRHRESLGPRLESQHHARPTPPEQILQEPTSEARNVEPRNFGDRMREVTPGRREPVIGSHGGPNPDPQSPLRPSPRIDAPDRT